MDQANPSEEVPGSSAAFVISNGVRDQRYNFEAASFMAGSLAHEFNNLLTGILGNLELLQRRATKSGIATFDDYLSGARNAAARATALTRRLLIVSGRQGLDPRLVSASQLIADMAGRVQETIGPQINLKLEIQDVAWLVKCDEEALQEAILDLVNNARDAMPEGGALVIRTENLVANSECKGLSAPVPDGEYVVVSVADSGHGMTDEIRACAFEPFFTTKTNRAHLGLGLSSVFGFVRQTGGYVELAAAASGGTTIRLYFRRAEAET